MPKPIYQLRTFTAAGVRFVRETPFHEQGRYSAIDAGGREWRVIGDGSNRYPWRLVAPDGAEFYQPNLHSAAAFIAGRSPARSPYRDSPTEESFPCARQK